MQQAARQYRRLSDGGLFPLTYKNFVLFTDLCTSCMIFFLIHCVGRSENDAVCNFYTNANAAIDNKTYMQSNFCRVQYGQAE